MSRDGQFVLGAIVGGLTAVLLFATQRSFPWQTSFWERLPVLMLPVVVLGGLIALGWLRKQYAAALGYLLGVSPIVALPLLVLGIFGALQSWQSLYALSERLQRRPFEARVWREQTNDRTRARMVDDLMQSRKLAGLPLNEAQALLGPASDNLGVSECALAYWLGTDRGWLCLSAVGGRINSIRLREYDD